jgi:hypothetical protein
MLINSIVEGYNFDILPSSLLFFIRFLINTLASLIIIHQLNSLAQLKKIFKIILIASLFTNIISILYALPITKSLTEALFFKNQLFFPNRLKFFDDGEEFHRIKSLFGGSTLVSMWTNTTFAISFYFLMSKKELFKKYNVLLLLFCSLTSFIVLFFSFSRSAYIVFFVLVAWYFFKSIKAYFRIFLFIIIISSIVPFQNFKSFDRVQNFDTEHSYTNNARIFAYTKLFPFLLEHPSYFLIGHGVTVTHKFPEKLPVNFGDGRSHAFISSATFYYGFIFSIIVILFYILTIYKNFIKSKIFTKLPFAISVVPLGGFLTDHFISGTARSWTLFIMLIFLSIKIRKIYLYNINYSHGKNS